MIKFFLLWILNQKMKITSQHCFTFRRRRICWIFRSYIDRYRITTPSWWPKRYTGLPTTSLFWKVLYSIKDNNTFGLLDRTADSQHSREFRNMPKETEKSRSTIRIDRNGDPRRKHPRNIRPRYSQMSTR